MRGRFVEKARAERREPRIHLPSMAGWRVIRLIWRRLDEDADGIAHQLAALLSD